MKYILLDIHGVLTKGDERKLFLAEMEKEYNMNYDQHNSLWIEHIDNLDKNIEKPSRYLTIINKTFKTHFTVDAYYQRFLKQITPNTKLIQKLKETEIETYIVSDNFSSIAKGLSPILGKEFKYYKKYYSHKLGSTKKGGMLKQVLKLLSVKANECLFIDDGEKNIEVAKNLGIYSILFKSNEDLFSKLDELLIK